MCRSPPPEMPKTGNHCAGHVRELPGWVRRGASRVAKNLDEKTPLEVARLNSQDKVVALLEKPNDM